MSMAPFVPSTPVEEFFSRLSAVPRGSKNEAASADLICSLAAGAGLEHHRDALGNVLVKKAAAPGREGAAPVLLQAHLDMVCTKDPGCAHDFERDPLTLLVDGDGWLHADGTTLGADDGYGVAYMLALLLGRDVKHPPLECLFTVQEEIGLIGAAAYDTSLLRARRMISLDSEGEDVTTVSTCGGRRVTFTLPLTAAANAEGTRMRLCVDGLTGGHSAGEIHRGRANAINLLGHALMALEDTGAALEDARGGEAANAIPRSAEAVLRVPEGAVQRALRAVEALEARCQKLYAATDPGLRLTLSSCGDGGRTGAAWTLDGGRFLCALPDGVRYMDPVRPGVKALSDNVGTLRLEGDALTVQVMIRSASPEHRDLLTEELLAAGGAFGASAGIDSDYPGFEYIPGSPLRALYCDVMRERLGITPTEEATHGGMEIGYFSRSIPGVDIVTLAPDASGCHSPSEKMSLASFNRMYGVLCALLERLD